MSICKIVKEFGFDIKKYSLLKPGYFIDTGNSLYILRKINFDIERLLFIHGAKEYLAKKGFQYTDRHLVTNGQPYVIYNNNIYVMTKYIQGREYSPFKEVDIKEASKTLAKFHNASRGYMAKQEHKKDSNLGKWQEILLGRCEDFNYMKNLVQMKSYKNNIDKLFLNNIDTIYKRGIEAVKLLQKSGYFELVSFEGKERFLCHNNMNSSNIIIDSNNICNIINFDFCKFELRCFDIAILIKNSMKKLNWNFEKALDIIESYNNIRLLKNNEFKIIAAIIQFPQEFWTLSSYYYYEKGFLTDFTYYLCLKNTINEIYSQTRFLEKYNRRFIE